MSTPNSKQASRFSTLKVFNFSNGGTPKPPKPPSKDGYYLQPGASSSYVSLAPSLSQETSVPPTPFSPSVRSPSPTPSRSTTASTSVSVFGATPESSKKKGFRLGFGRKSKSPAASMDSPNGGQDDDNISMPWNFQHNVHVDENMRGLPPSWSSSLQEAGFTDDEIVALQARRMRSPATVPILTNTAPRKSSLPRQYSDGPYTGSPASSLSGHGPPSQVPARKASDASSVFGPDSQFIIVTGNDNSAGSSAPSSAQSRTRTASTSTAASDSFVRMSDSEDGASSMLHTPQKPRAGAETPNSPPPVYHLTEPLSIRTPDIRLSELDSDEEADDAEHESRRDTIIPESKRTTIIPPDIGKRDTIKASPARLDAPTLVKKSSASDLSRSATMSTITSPRSPRFAPRIPASPRSGTFPTTTAGSSGSSNTASGRPPSPTRHGRRRSKRFSVLPPRLSLDTRALGDLSSWSASLFDTMSANADEDDGNALSGGQASALEKLTGKMATPPATSSSASALPPRLPPLNEAPASPARSIAPKVGLPASPRVGPPARAPSTTQQPASRTGQAWPPPASRMPAPLPVVPPRAPVPPSLPLNNPTRAAASAEASKSSNKPVVTPTSAAAFHARYKGERHKPAPLVRLADSPPTSATSIHSAGASSVIDDVLSASVQTPLWDELMEMVTPSTSEVLGTPSPRSAPITPFTPALEENSPVVPPRARSPARAISPTPAPIGPLPRPPMDALNPVSSPPASRPESPLLTPQKDNAQRYSAGTIKSDRDSSATVTAEVVRAAVVTYSRAVVVPAAAGIASNGGRAPGPARNVSAAAPSSTAPVSSKPSPEADEELSPPTPGLSYLESPLPSPGQPSPMPSAWKAGFSASALEPVPQHLSVGRDDEESGGEDEGESGPVAGRPRIVVSGIGLPPALEPVSAGPSSTPSSVSPATPGMHYRGWLSEVLAILEEFIDETTDPRTLYGSLREVAEGESGSVYAASTTPEFGKLRLKSGKGRADKSPSASTSVVAIKSIPVSPSGTPKIEDLQRELTLMRGVTHANILTMDMLYVDLVEDALWIRMELMDTSLADVIGLVEEGIQLTEDVIARFTSDALSALGYLHTMHIAHRDVRSDNMLVNSEGVLKLSDFSNAVKSTSDEFVCEEPTGVVYWQAPEMRRGAYDPMKVDVFSLGATVWEMAQAQPPFSDVEDIRDIADEWPPLDAPDEYTHAFHDFLRLCSMPAPSRPNPKDLIHTPFIRSAVPRIDILHLLSQCKSIEEEMQQ